MARRLNAGRKVADARDYAVHYDQLAVIISKALNVYDELVKMNPLMSQVVGKRKDDLWGRHDVAIEAVLAVADMAESIMEADRAAIQAELEAEGL